MNVERSRRYPDEPAGPFPTPPATHTDAEGRDLAIERVATDGAVHDSLTRMYDRFNPADRAQGIPPTGEAQIRDWLDPLIDTGVNVAVRPLEPTASATAGQTTPDASTPDAATDADRNDDADADATSADTGSIEYVGHAVLVPDTDESGALDDPGRYEWELAIFVLQEYQGAGVGTALLEHLLGEATAVGIEHVWLTVERWNSPAISLYESTGFESVGTERFDIEMSIQLDPA
ncbi:acetyltransferase [Halovivax ruber XH-70]|uniref:Acetyltransferase n=1 Tax=Halovivax ruber (strain DSM 18193 / JCM 13892 / XH-70) TaxID=797302 RepID=L0I8S2_HALRX|nr:GNAT family N-acetyltransferase [Halovivax ruber]AGB15208.1 acetyltransferase [Halovivax ruber XH-70]